MAEFSEWYRSQANEESPEIVKLVNYRLEKSVEKAAILIIALPRGRRPMVYGKKFIRSERAAAWQSVKPSRFLRDLASTAIAPNVFI